MCNLSSILHYPLLRIATVFSFQGSAYLLPIDGIADISSGTKKRISLTNSCFAVETKVTLVSSVPTPIQAIKKAMQAIILVIK
ncbi:MAG TPA: hypothetical protein VIY48_14325 [Candidatus Paceibacterota bacterium]